MSNSLPRVRREQDGTGSRAEVRGQEQDLMGRCLKLQVIKHLKTTETPKLYF